MVIEPGPSERESRHGLDIQLETSVVVSVQRVVGGDDTRTADRRPGIDINAVDGQDAVSRQPRPRDWGTSVTETFCVAAPQTPIPDSTSESACESARSPSSGSMPSIGYVPAPMDFCDSHAPLVYVVRQAESAEIRCMPISTAACA